MAPRTLPSLRPVLPALATVLICLLLPAALSLASQTAKPEEKDFDDHIAAQLMHQIDDALVARNPKKMLEAFDVAKMADGPLFRQQINSFFGQTADIRVHFNLVEASMQDGKGVAKVDAEMEANLRDDNLTPVRKQAQLRFVAEKSGGGWKWTDVEPRSFFSITQP